MIINQRLKEIREESHQTQAFVAGKTCMSTRAYQRLEKDAKPHYDGLERLADHFGVSVDWLMGRTDKREVNR